MDNFSVMSPVLKNLCGYWTKKHQTPPWEYDTHGDIRMLENHLRKVITRYAARAT